jgi:hypothetical protein
MEKISKDFTLFVADKIVLFILPPLCMLLKAKPFPAKQREERLRDRGKMISHYCGA